MSVVPWSWYERISSWEVVEGQLKEWALAEVFGGASGGGLALATAQGGELTESPVAADG